ncbi:hypothetical protein LAZ67_17000116 [Cordylochernes scorpioides]|uniref:Uncharacterized protein n=1 Tax=Cordylochernes scorpioides TaxID=51811 RepID=A0ABY6LCH9_9ARAC|nr:hypothetical protein LAZ67_17000116 [Cordylochernes scorpioides]
MDDCAHYQEIIIEAIVAYEYAQKQVEKGYFDEESKRAQVERKCFAEKGEKAQVKKKSVVEVDESHRAEVKKESVEADEEKRLDVEQGMDSKNTEEVKLLYAEQGTDSRVAEGLDAEQGTDSKVEEEKIDAEQGTDSKVEEKIDAEQGTDSKVEEKIMQNKVLIQRWKKRYMQNKVEEEKLDAEQGTDSKVEEEKLDAEQGTDSKVAEVKLDVEQSTESKMEEQIIDTKDWLNEGFIEGVKEDPPEVKGHYLPRHLLLRSESKTTPIRPVFDNASCRGHDGLALRRYLKRRPNLLRRIPEIRIEFRENKFGILADIRRYFRLMAIKENDWDYLRFLWKKKWITDEREIVECDDAKVGESKTLSKQGCTIQITYVKREPIEKSSFGKYLPNNEMQLVSKETVSGTVITPILYTPASSPKGQVPTPEKNLNLGDKSPEKSESYDCSKPSDDTSKPSDDTSKPADDASASDSDSSRGKAQGSQEVPEIAVEDSDEYDYLSRNGKGKA